MERGLTLGEIFKVIFKRIWWVLGATVLGLIVAVLISELWYNRETEYYTVSYEIVYPDSGSGKYPDGSDLILSDSISLETLTDIKEGVYSKENPDEFKGIDVNDMHDNDDISVSSGVNSEGGSFKLSCTLTVKAKYFTGVEQARAFLRTVAEYPVNRVNSVIANKRYSANLVGYDEAPSYEEKISALTAQKNYLEAEYSKLSVYGEKADAGKALLRNIFTTAQQNELKAHITAYNYVLNPDVFKASADAEKAALQKNIDDNVKIIAELRAEQKNAGTTADTPVVTDPYEERIAALTAQNSGWQNRIDEINKTEDEIVKYTTEGTDEYAAKQAFDSRLDEFHTQLKGASDTLKVISVSIYNDNSRAVFSSNKLEPQGGLHWAASAFLGALIGFVLSSLVVCIIDVPKYKRSKLAATTEEQTASDEEKDAAEVAEG